MPRMLSTRGTTDWRTRRPRKDEAGNALPMEKVAMSVCLNRTRPPLSFVSTRLVRQAAKACGKSNKLGRMQFLAQFAARRLWVLTDGVR